MQVPWGPALPQCLGDALRRGRNTTRARLIKTAAEKLPILIDRGEANEFSMTVEAMAAKGAADAAGYPVCLRMQRLAMTTATTSSRFIGEHIAHHAFNLKSV